MWYPKRTRIAELRNELRSHEREIEARTSDVDGFLRRVSDSIRSLALGKQIPVHHMRDWVWILSQYRIHRADHADASRLSARALIYLQKLCSRSGNPEEMVAEARWVKNQTIWDLRDKLSAEAYQSFLGPGELERTERLWSELRHAPDVPVSALAEAIKPYTASFSSVESPAYLPGMKIMIEELLERAQEGGENADWAAAALRYLIRESDGIPDSLGYAGLVDDIHVLERAYGMVGNEAMWGPVLRRFLEQWPFIEDLEINDGSGDHRLSRYLQMICAGSLQCLLGGRPQSCIVLADPGPVAILVALVAVLHSIKHQSDSQRRSLDALEYGDHVILSDSSVRFVAQYLRPGELDGRRLHWLLLADDVRIGLPEDAAGLLRKSVKPNRKLSSHAQYAKWKMGYSPNPLGHVIGRDVNLDSIEPQVLLLSRRNKLDELLENLRPLGRPITDLVGIRYFSKTGAKTQLGSAAAGNPLLWVCSDPGVAVDLLRGQLEKASPQFTIVDGGDLGEGLIGCRAAGSRLVIAGQHEWESIAKLKSSGQPLWHLRHHDVRVSARSVPDQIDGSGGPLVRYMTRQALRAVTEAVFHEVRNPMIEDIESQHHALRKAATSDPALGDLALLSAHLLRLVQGHVLEPTPAEQSEFRRVAAMVSKRASSFRLFHDAAAALCDLLEPHVHGANLEVGREAVLRPLVDRLQGRTAVLCASAVRAEQAVARTRSDGTLHRVTWIGPQSLRSKAPFDDLLIPGWFDRSLMREIRAGGLAVRQHYVLFPFEMRWEGRSRTAGERRQRELQRESGDRWNELPERCREGSRRPKAPPPPEMPDPVPETVAYEEATPFEWLEAARAERIRNSWAGRPRSELAKARLVLFEDPSCYALLPPQGSVVDVTEVLGGIHAGGSADPADAEALIIRPVDEIRPGSLLAFPESANRELLDELADKLIRDPDGVRRYAGLWRTALREDSRAQGDDLTAIQRHLERAGVQRTAGTLYQWIHSSQVVAPRGWREAIPVIAEVTRDERLKAQMENVLSSVDLIYRARREAAARLVQQLVHASLPDEKGVLSVEIEGHSVQYKVLRVRSIDEARDYPHDTVGLLHYEHLSEMDEDQ